MLSEIFAHLFMTKKLQSHWRRKLMKCWITHVRSRFALCSLWSVIFLRLSYVYCTLLAPQNLHRLLFSDPLGRTVYSQKDMKTIPYAKFAGQTEYIMGDSKIVSGKEVRAHSSHLFLTILLYGAMEFFWPRTFESSGVENTPYVRACIRKTAI